MEIKIEGILIRKGFNVRDELGDLSDLIDSIKETKGVLSPILVCKIPDSDQFELLAGERRLEAAKEAKYKTIDCSVKEAKNDYEKFQIMYHENLGRKELTWVERAKATKLQFEISKRFNITIHDIAEGQDRSTRTAFRYLSAAKAIEEFPVLAKEGSLSVALSKYRKIKELDLRTQLKLKNNEIGIKQAILIEKKHQIVRDIDSGSLVIDELKKEVDYYKGHLLELVKQKDKEERIPEGIWLFDEMKTIVKAARSCEAFGMKDIQKDACEECKKTSPQVNQICDWWFENAK
jgi:ParB/RepB/Spo0J family partition protein